MSSCFVETKGGVRATQTRHKTSVGEMGVQFQSRDVGQRGSTKSGGGWFRYKGGSPGDDMIAMAGGRVITAASGRVPSDMGWHSRSTYRYTPCKTPFWHDGDQRD